MRVEALSFLLACGHTDDPTPSVRDADADGVAAGEDCDDDDGAIRPGAEEHCNAIDDDCDGDVDEDAVDAIAIYADTDGDGYGAEPEWSACAANVGQSTLDGDCDDTDPGAHPGAVEICNDGRDDDCNGIADGYDAVGGTSWYADLDGDGYGGGAPTVACTAPPGGTSDGTDCNDLDDATHPGAPETCNGADDDCDPFTRETGMVTVDDAIFWSVQEAVDAALTGDTVELCDGTWFENVRLERTVAIEGRGSDLSIIDGSGSGSVVSVVTDGIAVYLEGLTLQNGSGEYLTGPGAVAGGGVRAWSARHLEIRSSVITMNTADIGAGILAPFQGDIVLEDTTVSDNAAAEDGGGAYFLSHDYSGTTDIDGCTFTGNTSGSYGAGFYTMSDHQGNAISVTDTLIDSNVVLEGGGGGGGFYVEDRVALFGVTISNNVAPRGAGVFGDGDVRADEATEVHDNATYDNGHGGGVYTSGKWLSGHVWGNSAAVGGGFALNYGEIEDVVVEGNHATIAGGGIYLNEGANVTDSEVTGNTSDGVGGGLYADPSVFSSEAELENVLVAGNVAATQGGGAWVEEDFSSVGSDWGSGATDNEPDDLVFFDADEGKAVVYDDIGGDFTCELIRGTCE